MLASSLSDGFSQSSDTVNSFIAAKKNSEHEFGCKDILNSHWLFFSYPALLRVYKDKILWFSLYKNPNRILETGSNNISTSYMLPCKIEFTNSFRNLINTGIRDKSVCLYVIFQFKC